MTDPAARICNSPVSGNSSVGRAQPCQGWGREFESRFPLQIAIETSVTSEVSAGVFVWLRMESSVSITPNMAGWQSGYAAACKAVYLGSTPGPASIILPVYSRIRRDFRNGYPYNSGCCKGVSPGGEIGRRKGLKIPRWRHRAGSIPAPGTNSRSGRFANLF